MNLGKAIKDIRVMLELTQMEAVKKIKCSQTFLSQIENGQKEPSHDMIRRIAKAYRVPLVVFMSMGAEISDVKPSWGEDGGKKLLGVVKGICELYFNELEEVKLKKN